MPNGRVVGSEFYVEKLVWLARLSDWLDDTDPGHRWPSAATSTSRPPTTTSRTRWRRTAAPTSRRGSARRSRSCGVGPGRRRARFHPEPGFFTWWDYRAGNFHKNLGMRIDHVYVTAPLAARAVAAERDRDARKPSTYPGIPSDHAPLIVDFADQA